MADGYAQATGRPSFLNVHTATGLGNAMGNLSNSRATGTPIVVTAGQQDRRHLLAEPFLSGNLTGMAAGLVKWAHEVHRTADLGPVLRRAFHDAASPPTGPVFVSIPMDVLQDEGEFAVPAASRIERRAVPAALADLASAILAAPRARFAVVAGDEVARSGATGALAALAERLGLPGLRHRDALHAGVSHGSPAVGRCAAGGRRAGARPPGRAPHRAAHRLARVHDLRVPGDLAGAPGAPAAPPLPRRGRHRADLPGLAGAGRRPARHPRGAPAAAVRDRRDGDQGADAGRRGTGRGTAAPAARAGPDGRAPARTGACIRCRRSRRCWRRCRPKP